MMDLAKNDGLLSFPVGVSPSSFIDTTLVMDYLSPETGLGPSEQLYTARGVQGGGIVQSDADILNVEAENYESTYLFTDLNFNRYGNRYYQKRALWTTKKAPDYAP